MQEALSWYISTSTAGIFVAVMLGRPCNWIQLTTKTKTEDLLSGTKLNKRISKYALSKGPHQASRRHSAVLNKRRRGGGAVGWSQLPPLSPLGPRRAASFLPSQDREILSRALLHKCRDGRRHLAEHFLLSPSLSGSAVTPLNYAAFLLARGRKAVRVYRENWAEGDRGGLLAFLGAGAGAEGRLFWREGVGSVARPWGMSAMSVPAGLLHTGRLWPGRDLQQRAAHLRRPVVAFHGGKEPEAPGLVLQPCSSEDGRLACPAARGQGCPALVNGPVWVRGSCAGTSTSPVSDAPLCHPGWLTVTGKMMCCDSRTIWCSP